MRQDVPTDACLHSPEHCVETPRIRLSCTPVLVLECRGRLGFSIENFETFVQGRPAVKEHLREKRRSSQFLSGWKEIANYLGKGVRTVQRYERQMGLPVRRPAGRSCGSVVAVRAELDGWVKASPIRQAFRLRNTSLESPSPAQAIRMGVAELIQLRQQMSKLRSEMNKSLQLLRNSIYALQGELKHSRADSYNLYSPNERDLLDATPSNLAVVPIKYPQAS
jgi:hypothetical protein